MDEGFDESSNETSLRKEENEMSHYYPDFSDMHEEKFKFWDFLAEDHPQSRSNNPSDETNVSKHALVEEGGAPFSDSGVFWDFLGSSDPREPSKGRLLSESSLAHDFPGSDTEETRRPSDFWDFISSPDSLQHVEQSCSRGQQFHQPESSGAATYEIFNNDKKKDTNTDDFWDFLNSNTSVDLDYKMVLRDVVSPHLSAESEWPRHFQKPHNVIQKNKTVDETNEKLSAEEKDFQLPCISSVFSLKSFPGDYNNSTFSELNPNPLTCIQETGRNNKEKALHEKTPSMDQNATSEDPLANIVTNSKINFYQSNCLNRTANVSTSISTVFNEGQNSKIYNPNESLQALPISVKKAGISAHKDNTKQVCLLLQNSETFTNPNYSHFFVIFNGNAPQPQQISTFKNAGDKVHNINASPQKVVTLASSPNSSAQHPTRGESTLNEKIGAEKASSEDQGPQRKDQSESNEELERNKYLAGYRNNYILNLNSHKRRKENKLSTWTDSGIKCEMPLCCEALSEEKLSRLDAQATVTSRSDMATTVAGHLKQHKQTRPIKRISLGKHKNAIQQVNSPVRLDDLIKTVKGPKQNSSKSKVSSANALTASCDHLINKNTLFPVSSNRVNCDKIKISNMFICNNSILLPTNPVIYQHQQPKIQINACGENKSLVNSLFPVSVNVAPNTVVLTSHAPSQPAVSKPFVVQRSNHAEKSQRETSKRVTTKLKGRRKTVKELLQERHHGSDPKKSQTSRREIRVLRPLCRIPTAQEPVPASDHSSKRPNIMILPSATRPRDERKTPPFILSVSPSDDSLTPFCKSSEEGRGRRPRYYDLSELQVGYFKVEDDVDASGRFRSKFKVIFTKCQFLYDFPVSRCNQPELKKAETSGQMARVTIPFQSVTSMSMRDRIIHLSLSETPRISLGVVTSRSGKFSDVYETDSSWKDCLRSTFTHKVVLRKRQAGKLRLSLCQFDRRFVSLTSISAHGHLARNPPSGHFHEAVKSKKSSVRRLPQWDAASGEHKSEEDLLINQVCSCRTNCRYVRCSCVKAAKSCSFSGSMCQCVNCNNPLNVLETIGIDVDFSVQDSCLFQNIYQIPELLNYLQREVRLECCKSFARIQDCIPGTVLCPNIDCDTRLEFSWCHRVVCYPEYNPRNHCSFCGQCRFSSKYHCFTCKRCYALSAKTTSCPRCEKDHAVSAAFPESKPPSKQSSKPEIIVLQSSIGHSAPKKETSAAGGLSEKLSPGDDCEEAGMKGAEAGQSGRGGLV